MRVRDYSHSPTIIINNKDDTPILNSADRKARWMEYFQELYNPKLTTEHYYEAKDQEIIQPEILSQEMETPIKKNSQNKSSNTSGMPHEAIKSCNEIRVN